MARETREVREKRQAEEAAVKFAEETKNWNVRLMDVMIAFANLSGYSIKKYDDIYNQDYKVELEASEEVGFGSITVLRLVPVKYDDVYDMEEAERMITRYHELRAEEKRQLEVRNSALNKLTTEEKQLLGLLSS